MNTTQQYCKCIFLETPCTSVLCFEKWTVDCFWIDYFWQLFLLSSFKLNPSVTIAHHGGWFLVKKWVAVCWQLSLLGVYLLVLFDFSLFELALFNTQKVGHCALAAVSCWNVYCLQELGLLTPLIRSGAVLIRNIPIMLGLSWLRFKK